MLSMPKERFMFLLQVLVSLSLVLQVLVGVMLVVLGRKNIENAEEKQSAKRLNDKTVGLVFAITVLNIFIGGFGIKLSDD